MITLLGDDIKIHLICRKGSRPLVNCSTLLLMRNHFTALYSISLCQGFEVVPVDLKVVPFRAEDRIIHLFCNSLLSLLCARTVLGPWDNMVDCLVQGA